MKRIKRIFLAILSVLMIAVSCAKLDGAYRDFLPPINNSGEYAIVFNNSDILTKAEAVSTSGNGYDDFSLYAWNSSNDTIMNPFRVAAIGADSYEYAGIDGQTLQYFRNNADSYSFIGIIPTTDVKVKNGSVKVGVESFVVDDNRVSGTLTADSPKEFLWARADVAKANYGQTVALPFKHGNALLYIGFISDDANTQILNYTPEIPGTSVPGTVTTKTEKMFTEMASGNLVSYALTPFQGDEHGEYRGFKGNYFNLNPYLTGYSYISKERLEELMPLVNAQFVYTDINNNDISDVDWVYGADKKHKIFLKFASGVDPAEFAAGNDAFWTNLTPAEKTKMQNHHDSGCRIIRINKLSDGNYFAWGETYGYEVSYSGRDLRIINGGTIGHPATPSIPGIRVFSAKTDPTDGYAHLAHTNTADATVATGLTFDNRVAVTDSIQFSLPSPTTVPVGTTEAQAVYSPTTFYSIPGDVGLTHFVVKVSYTYKGITVYDVRVPLDLPASGLESGKYYKYIINITSIYNGTTDPSTASDEKDDIDMDNPIHVTVSVSDYEEGITKIITI